MASSTVDIIGRLGALRDGLSTGGDAFEDARNEALRLSRQLASSLEKPATTAVDLAFAVRTSSHVYSFRLHWLTITI
jgi:hypothetical protein